MTLRSRNRFSRMYIFLIMAVVGALLWFVVLPRWDGLIVNHPWAFFSVLFSSAFGLLFSLFLIRLFQRTLTAPVFFVVLALATAGLDMFKLMNLFAPEFGVAGTVVMRVLVIAHLSFALSLFVSGICATELNFQRHGLVLFILVGVSLSLAWGMPVDAFVVLPNLLSPVGPGNSVVLVVGTFLLLTMITYVQTGIKNRDGRVLAAGLAVTLMALGHELLYYGSGPVLFFLGITGSIVGAVLYTSRSYRDQVFD